MKFVEYRLTPFDIRISSTYPCQYLLLSPPIAKGLPEDVGVQEIAVSADPTPFTQILMPVAVFVSAMWFHWFATTFSVEVTWTHPPFQ